MKPVLSVKDCLIAAGIDVDQSRIKLVKHVDKASGEWTIRNLINQNAFEFYQSEQGGLKQPFHDCDVIVSFLALENNLAEFWGVYKVLDSRPFTKIDVKRSPKVLGIQSEYTPKGNKRIWYELEEIKGFRPLRQRLVVQWLSTRGWVQKKDLDIYELLPPIKSIPFPGYQDVILTFDSLRQIFNNPRAHKDWKAALEANAGIYRIVDMSNGAVYIGSAYGYEGLWGRWSNYAKTGHGGNKLLKDRDPDNFQWSIVRTVSRSMSERDVIKIEAVEKQKHGSRVHGLNDN